VALCLMRTQLSRNERIFVASAGLKGAVPILLGSLLLGAHVLHAERLYGIVVVVVMFSVLVQGTLVPTFARLLHLPMQTVNQEPWAVGVRLADEPEGVHLLTVEAGAAADGARIDELELLPESAWISLLVRDNRLMPVNGERRLQAGDDVLILADNDSRSDLVAAFRRRA
jgi:potassium/hydrogen antiporter